MSTEKQGEHGVFLPNLQGIFSSVEGSSAEVTKARLFFHVGSKCATGWSPKSLSSIRRPDSLLHSVISIPISSEKIEYFFTFLLSTPPSSLFTSFTFPKLTWLAWEVHVSSATRTEVLRNVRQNDARLLEESKGNRVSSAPKRQQHWCK